MHLHAVIILVLINLILGSQLWDKNRNCPLTCTCQLEHLTETAIYRFMQNNKVKENPREMSSVEFNDVIYEDNLESELMADNQIVRSAICILSSTVEPEELIVTLPEDLETLTLIQGFNTTEKTVKFSYLERFKNLLSLELLGPNLLSQNNGRIMAEIDTPLPNLKFINLENIQIKNSKMQLQNFIKEFGKEEQTFEFVQKFDENSHALTIVQKSSNDDILPYDKYKEQDNENKVPLFVGFKNLILLKVTRCDLNTVHWTMFDGLQNLQYLILDNNNLRFIPPFAFYGTPNLKTLSLAHNNLLNIQITDLAGLLELEYLYLSYNNFSQLSELSLPPFPKLKLADFTNNPITAIFPNTFEVMNTTDSLIIGSDDVNLSLMTNSFMGLKLLKALTLHKLKIKLLTRDLFVGMPSLTELTLTGNITQIEFDAFLETRKLKKLVLSYCNIKIISMDAFIGLESLEILDLSNNELEHLPPTVFDELINIKEIYLNNNKLTLLPQEIFSKIHVKMIRLNENPWHCSCEMSDWKPIIINRIKQKILKECDFTHDKGIRCSQTSGFMFKYVYENKVAPKCVEPQKYKNWSVFHVMRRLLKCPNYKPKFRKHRKITSDETTSSPNTTQAFYSSTINEYSKSTKIEDQNYSNLKNDDNLIQPLPHHRFNHQKYIKTKAGKYKKHKKVQLNNDVPYL